MTTNKIFALLLLGLAFSLPVHADALNEQLATKAALDALFSIEAVQPEGSERQEPPKGFAGNEASEDDLIEFLAQQKRLGADLNSYRHLGTPLHHAIRSGLYKVARWLLKNGANPLFRVKGDGEFGASPSPDALGVAVNVGAWDMLDELQRHPKYKSLSPDDLARAIWPYAMDSGDKTAMLASKRIPLPNYRTQPQLAEALLVHSLCTGQPHLALALLSQPDVPTKLQSVRRPGASPCPQTGKAPSQAFQALPLSEWKAIEDRLQWPVSPFLVASAQTTTQAEQLLAAGLRAPWEDPTAASQFTWGALQIAQPATPLRLHATQPVTLLLLHAMPPAALQTALREPELMSAWLTAAADWPLPETRWALSQIDSTQLRMQLARVMERWRYASATGADAKDPGERLARWALLTDELTQPLPVIPSDGFLYWVPIELWPRWFALGYRVDDQQWATWINWVEPALFEKAWPAISKYQPDIANRTLAWLVAPLSVGPIGDAQAKRLSYTGGYYYDENFWRKASFLDKQGARIDQPRWLAAAYISLTDKPGIQLALDKNWVRIAPPALRATLIRAPLDCQQRPQAALRRSLASSSPLIGDDGQHMDIDSIQPIALPGKVECAWIVYGTTSGGRKFINDESFSEGVRRLTPCTDGSTSAALWDNSRGTWAPVGGMPNGGLTPIRQKDGGQTVFISSEVDEGNCGNAPGGIFMPRFTENGELGFDPLGPGDALFDALALQCDFMSITTCFHMDTEGAHPTDAVSLPFFFDRAWAKEKAEFLAAIDRLDRHVLSYMRDKDGITADWLDEALRHISTSTALTIPEKRRRVAWVLAQRTPRPAFSTATLDSLVPWLPPEDWGPILKVFRCDQYGLERLAEQAMAQQLTTLHRRIESAKAEVCTK